MARRVWAWIALVLLMMLPCAHAWAQVQMEAQVGYDRTVLDGRWFPLEVQMTNDGDAVRGTLSVELLQNADNEFDRYEWPVTLTAGETLCIRVPVYTLAEQRAFSVKLREGNAVIAATEAYAEDAVPSGALLIGVADADTALAKSLNEATSGAVLGRRQSIRVLAVCTEQLVSTPEMLGAFDALVVPGQTLASMTDEQRVWIQSWLFQGGVLLSDQEASWLHGQEGVQIIGDAYTAQELLSKIAADAARYEALFGRRHVQNYRYDSTLGERMLIDDGRSITPVLMLLAAYVAVGGVGLYLWLRRRDQCKRLWFCLPVLAVAATGCVALLANLLGVGEPTAASFRVTQVDEQGHVTTEERSLVAFADQDRVTMAAADGARVVRRTSGYFYGNLYDDAEVMQRDVISMGDPQTIALKPTAPWLPRSLVIEHEDVPEGTVTGSVWMEKDGLHAEIKNGMDIPLEQAVLFTGLGYASIGTIAAGETKAVRIARPETMTQNKNGDQAILDGELLTYPRALSEVTEAKVLPQLQMKENAKIEANHAQKLAQTKYNMLLSGENAGLACMLIADTPSLPCTQLLKDGKPITRMAQESMIVVRLPFEHVGRTGVAYYPADMFPAYKAVQGMKGPELDERFDEYSAELSGGALFGFDLGDAAEVQIDTLRIMASYSLTRSAQLSLEVYDRLLEDWVEIRGGTQCALDSTIVSRVIDEEGHVFIRYTDKAQSGYGVVYQPKMIVEGSVRQ